MIELASLILIVLGNLNVMLAMDRHHRTYLGRFKSLGNKRAMRLSGTAMLLIALVLLVHAAGLGAGLTEWTLLAGAAAILQSLLLPIVFRGEAARHLTLSPTAAKKGRYYAPPFDRTHGQDSHLET